MKSDYSCICPKLEKWNYGEVLVNEGESMDTLQGQNIAYQKLTQVVVCSVCKKSDLITYRIKIEKVTSIPE